MTDTLDPKITAAPANAGSDETVSRPPQPTPAVVQPPALKRRIPKVADLAPLMQFKKPEFSKAARLKRASTIWELRDIAKRRTPQAPFDYTDGAAEEEITLRRARPRAFEDLEFRPESFAMFRVDLRTDILGRNRASPSASRPPDSPA